MREDNSKKVVMFVILVVLIVLSFLLLKPLLFAIIIGLILTFIFTPLYNWIHKRIKSKNISASLICLLLITVIVLPIWLLIPALIDQSFKIYLASQQIDFVTLFKDIFPSLFEQFSGEIGFIIASFVTKITNSLVNSVSQLVLNFPALFLQLLVVFFTLFAVIKDKEKLLSYIRSLSPFSKDIETKLFKSSKGITSSLIYGQVIIGIIQGIFTGLGFFIFKVPNALVLTLVASLAGIFPIIGPVIVWVPVAIYLFIGGNIFSALGVVVFGVVASFLDNFLRPIIVSKKTNLPPSLILIGIIGGLFLFGILGMILGPLIIAYLLIVLDIYRNKQTPEILIREE
jgi:predicted PurR-regulated permease PerM